MAFFFGCLVIYSGVTASQALLLKFLVITPLTLFVNTCYYYLLACPCLIRQFENKWKENCASYLGMMGQMIAYPCALFSFVLLILSAYFVNSNHIAAVIKYAYQVHVVSILQDLFMTSLLFRYNHYTEYYICGITVLRTGAWFRELMEVFELKEGVEFTTKSFNFTIFE